jgi:uncharacterized protein (TIRG00374 family)
MYVSMQETEMSERRIPWSTIFGILLIGALAVLVYANWNEVDQAVTLMRTAQPIWLILAMGAVLGGFFCAGQIYGLILRTLGHSDSPFLLAGTALVTILLNQAVPAGSVAAYAFLVASLRKRGFPVASVAVVAGLEMLSWNGAVILAFVYGLIFLTTTLGATAPSVSGSAVAVAVVVLGLVLFIVTRPPEVLHDWGHRIRRFVNRFFGQSWSEEQVHHAINEIDASRRLVMEQPGRVLFLIILQLTVFILHCLALLAILHALGTDPPFFAVLAAYGLSLIVSTFVVLPGGGGAVEAALTVAMHAQGIPLQASLGAAIVFRLLSFWLMLPIGIVCYRILTRSVDQSNGRVEQPASYQDAQGNHQSDR